VIREVHADGVVGLFQGSGREVELDIVALFTALVVGLLDIQLRSAPALGQHIDALGVDGRHQVIELVGRGDVAGQQVVDLAVGEVALLLAGVDDAVYFFFVLIQFFCHGWRS
jgi:hypothetical protein